MKKVIYFLSLSILTLTASCDGGQAETPKDDGVEDAEIIDESK